MVDIDNRRINDDVGFVCACCMFLLFMSSNISVCDSVCVILYVVLFADSVSKSPAQRASKSPSLPTLSAGNCQILCTN